MDAEKYRLISRDIPHNQRDDAFGLIYGFETEQPKRSVRRWQAGLRDLHDFHAAQIISRRYGPAVFDDHVVGRAAAAICTSRHEPKVRISSGFIDDWMPPSILADQLTHINRIEHIGQGDNLLRSGKRSIRTPILFDALRQL